MVGLSCRGGCDCFLCYAVLLCGVLSRVTAHGAPHFHLNVSLFFLPTTRLAAINIMATHPQRSSRSHSPLETLPSFGPLSAPSRPSVMSVAAILAADIPFAGSGPAR